MTFHLIPLLTFYSLLKIAWQKYHFFFLVRPNSFTSISASMHLISLTYVDTNVVTFMPPKSYFPGSFISHSSRWFLHNSALLKPSTLLPPPNFRGCPDILFAGIIFILGKMFSRLPLPHLRVGPAPRSLPFQLFT